MQDADPFGSSDEWAISVSRTSLAVLGGIVCIFSGIGQLLYSFAAFAGLILFRAISLILAMGGNADQPDVASASLAAKAIVMAGVLFSLSSIFCGCVSLFQQKLSAILLAIPMTLAGFLALLHFHLGMSELGWPYVGLVLVFLLLVFAELLRMRLAFLRQESDIRE